MIRSKRWWNIYRHKKKKLCKPASGWRHNYMKFERRTKMIFRAAKMRKKAAA